MHKYIYIHLYTCIHVYTCMYIHRDEYCTKEVGGIFVGKTTFGINALC